MMGKLFPVVAELPLEHTGFHGNIDGAHYIQKSDYIQRCLVDV